MSEQAGPEVWDERVAPGGWVCAICGMPTESEPCVEHSREFSPEEDALNRLSDQAINTAGDVAGIRAAQADAGLISMALERLRAVEALIAAGDTRTLDDIEDPAVLLADLRAAATSEVRS